jgi:hypothetical protein
MDDPEIDIGETIRRMARETETAFAVVLASRTEDWLEFTIKLLMRKLSDAEAERLFSGFGPLSSFSAKIEVAYALKLFERDTLRDLRAIKDIRNRFAHAKDARHFDDPDLAPLLQKLSGWTKDRNKHRAGASLRPATPSVRISPISLSTYAGS